MVTDDSAARYEEKPGFAEALLSWYDGHARELPWRVPPGSGVRPDPYRVWLSEVMLQQTTVATVSPRFERFLALWPRVEDLAAAPLDAVLGEWAGLGYYARARNLHACAKVVAEAGVWPQTEEGLRALPGIGAYTAAAIAAIAMDEPAAVVDGNVERVIARLYAIERPIADEKPLIRTLADALTPRERPGDYAQGMMDLGATICRRRSADCLLCPVSSFCEARAAGVQDTLPAKAAKKEKARRRGVVYIGLRADGAVLVETRNSAGLYGGMAGLPGEGWSEAERGGPPFDAAWRAIGRASHTLTHRQLELTVKTAPADQAPKGFYFLERRALTRLPTVFRKCLALVHSPAED